MKHWVVGDIHGCYNLFQKLLKKIDGDDVQIILLGDIIDRGHQSVQMLEWAMKNIDNDDENAHYQMIIGNHEKNVIEDYNMSLALRAKNQTMLADGSIKEVKSTKPDILDNSFIAYQSHYGFGKYMYAGGYETLRDLAPVVEFFEDLPYIIRLSVYKGIKKQNYLLVHAWARLLPDGEVDYDEETFVWDRDIITEMKHFLEDYNPNGYGDKNEILIHGHTPTSKEWGYPEDCRVHKREHSINIDCGAFAYKSGGRLAAYCLETDEVVYVGLDD